MHALVNFLYPLGLGIGIGLMLSAAIDFHVSRRARR